MTVMLPSYTEVGKCDTFLQKCFLFFLLTKLIIKILSSSISPKPIEAPVIKIVFFINV